MAAVGFEAQASGAILHPLDDRATAVADSMGLLP